uniref:Uncharacterized protein n=1 Tax=Panagrolaimus superbus TaxID=310955 RepID=A0A914YFE7_9BILA
MPATTTTTDIPTVLTTTTIIAETAQTSETPVEIIEVPEEGKFVPSTETNQNPLKMHMNHEVTFGRDEEVKQSGIMEDITKTNFPIQNVEETDGSIEVDKEEGGDSEGEVFGEAAVTDILPHLELTTQSQVSEIQVASETTATLATSHFEREQPEELIADLPSEAPVDPNNEPAETDSESRFFWLRRN